MSPRELAGKQVLVLGLGDTGFSMARHLAHHGARVRVADSRHDPPMAGALSEAVPDAVLHTGAFREASFAGVDLLAISPGVDARQSLIHEAAKLGTPIVGDVELFAWALAALGDSPKVIGITGSNGKTTVTSMAGEMCRAAGLSTVIAGNIGLPVLDALRDAERDGFPQAFVLELSSFQLETSASLRLASASVLNLSEDHMDRYASLADYAAAKARIFANAAVRVVNRDDAATIAMAPDSPWSFGLSAPASSACSARPATSRWRRAARRSCRSPTCRSPGCTTPPTRWPRWRSPARSACRASRCWRRCAASAACRTASRKSPRSPA